MKDFKTKLDILEKNTEFDNMKIYFNSEKEFWWIFWRFVWDWDNYKMQIIS